MNYLQLGSGVVMTLYVIYLEIRIKELSKKLEIMKVRDEDQEITQKIHVEPDAALDSSLSKHLS